MKRGVWIVAAVVGVVLVLNALLTYNRLVAMSEGIDGQWAQVENQLQRRYDLIPNLVATVRGVAAQERSLVEAVTEARARLAGARTVEERVGAANQVESALARLLVVVENYPQLRSSESFRALMDELAGTENRIAVERMRYNDRVRAYNAVVRSLPTRLYAGALGFAPRSYFEPASAARAAPRVEF